MGRVLGLCGCEVWSAGATRLAWLPVRLLCGNQTSIASTGKMLVWSAFSLRKMGLDEVLRKEEEQEVERLRSAASLRFSSNPDHQWQRWQAGKLPRKVPNHGLPASGCEATPEASTGVGQCSLAGGTS